MANTKAQKRKTVTGPSDQGNEPSSDEPDPSYRTQAKWERTVKCLGCNSVFKPEITYKGYYCEDCRRRL